MSDNEQSVPTEGVDYGYTMIVWPSKGPVLETGNIVLVDSTSLMRQTSFS